VRNIIREYRKKKALLKEKYGIYPMFGESDSNFAHRVAIRRLAKGIDMVATESEVMHFLGWREETEDEQIERLVASEVRLAKRQNVLKRRYKGNEAKLTQDIREAIMSMSRLDKPRWVKDEG